MDLDGTINATAWERLTSKLAQKKGVLGTIIHWTCRDVEEIRECGYPVWAKGVCPRKSRSDFRSGTINELLLETGVKIKKTILLLQISLGLFVSLIN